MLSTLSITLSNFDTNEPSTDAGSLAAKTPMTARGAAPQQGLFGSRPKAAARQKTLYLQYDAPRHELAIVPPFDAIAGVRQILVSHDKTDC